MKNFYEVKSLRKRVQENFLGRVMDILVEDAHEVDGWARGRGANYLAVRFPFAERAVGRIIRVHMEQIEEKKLVLVGRPIHNGS